MSNSQVQHDDIRSLAEKRSIHWRRFAIGTGLAALIVTLWVFADFTPLSNNFATSPELDWDVLPRLLAVLPLFWSFGFCLRRVRFYEALHMDYAHKMYLLKLLENGVFSRPLDGAQPPCSEVVVEVLQTLCKTPITHTVHAQAQETPRQTQAPSPKVPPDRNVTIEVNQP